MMIENALLYILLPPLLYAETHYRFKYFFSYLKKREPGIIADIPSRVTRGNNVPILIIVKNADQYPVRVVTVEVLENNRTLRKENTERFFDSPYEDFIINFKPDELSSGSHLIDIRITYRVGDKEKTCHNDNHRGSSHNPLPIFISDTPYPCFDDCVFGETHAHSNYTNDQVEFGASLAATSTLAKSMGLDFFCATDHSYDLDDHMDNFLENDPDLKKWHAFKQEVKTLNTNKENILIVPGEEISVRNHRDENVHLLIYNSDVFYPGSGDSAEKWFRNRSELAIADVIDQNKGNALVFAAHPAEAPPFLQRLFIKRGHWHLQDCCSEGLTGMQFINDGESSSIRNGIRLWVDTLLLGHRRIGLAGTDAHGNFARYRQIGFPFFTINEHYQHLFGKWRTGVYLNNNPIGIPPILNSIRQGNCFVTDGPALQFKVLSGESWHPMGSTGVTPIKIHLMARSSPEFNSLATVKIFIGSFDSGTEKILIDESFKDERFEYDQTIPLKQVIEKGYLRAEVCTKSGSMALSNPIWTE